VAGRPLDPDATYTLTVNVGIVMLLPELGVEVSNVDILDLLEVNALRDHVVSLGKVKTRSEGRILEVR
jgi:hypothetical protein